MAFNVRMWTRKYHRWGAILVALPFFVVIVTGILLQLKKDWTWVQPPTIRGSGLRPSIGFDAILDAVKSVPEAEVQTWADVDRMDVRPNRGIVKVQAKNRWEIQVDLKTAEVVHAAYRRSDLIESLHDGSWFHDRAKLGIFLPTAGVVLILWGTGSYLFVLPNAVKSSRRRERANAKRTRLLS